MTVTEHVVRVAVVAPQERIDAFSAPALRERLDSLASEGLTQFVIDLSAVPFLDSAGLAALVSLLKRARAAGGDVKLVWPREEAAKRIFRLTRFDQVFEMAESADAALKGFGV
jgi:anti-anti-sigma factor